MEPVKKTPVALITVAWLFVGVPWGRGVVQLWEERAKAVCRCSRGTAPVSAPANGK
jgi:hypothetical protein